MAGISGAKSKLRKGGGRPQGWYKIADARWEEFESQKSGEGFIGFCFNGERPGEDPADIRLILGPTSGKRDVTQYVEVTKKGGLKSLDTDNPYQLSENSAPGRFFGSLSEHGVSDKIMDQVGDKPSALNGLIVHIIQEPVLDKDGEPKRNDAGYEITNTVVDKVGTAKDLKAAADSDGNGKGGKKNVSKKSKKDEDEDEEEEEDEETEDDDEDEEEEESDDDEDEDSDDEDEDEEEDEDDEEEEEEEEKPKKGKGKRR